MFDLLILGAGPGGYHLALRSAKEKLKVAIVEKEKFGGVCLNWGCIPSKAFLHVAKILHEVEAGKKMGIKDDSKVTIDQKKIVQYKDERVKMLVKSVENSVKRAGVEIFKGFGEILKREDGVIFVKVGNEILKCKNLVIATGSSTFVPKIQGIKEAFDNDFAITNIEILDLKEIPKHLIVLGAGIIGLEMASYYSQMGSKVTIIELQNKIAGPFENESSLILKKALEKSNVEFMLNSKLIEFKTNSVVVQTHKNEKIEIKSDKVLVSVGRIPNIKGIGLENIDIFIDKNSIKTDDKLRTNVPNVYAIGDVNGKMMLAHTAMREGEIVLDDILKIRDTRINYNAIPSVIYCYPEIAEIGITKERAKEQNIDFEVKEVKKLSMAQSGRYIVEENDYVGVLEFILNKDNQEIIGISIVGNYASEIINIASVFVGKRFSAEQIRDVVFSHPTVGEVIKDLLFD